MAGRTCHQQTKSILSAWRPLQHGQHSAEAAQCSVSSCSHRARSDQQNHLSPIVYFCSWKRYLKNTFLLLNDSYTTKVRWWFRVSQVKSDSHLIKVKSVENKRRPNSPEKFSSRLVHCCCLSTASHWTYTREVKCPIPINSHKPSALMPNVLFGVYPPFAETVMVLCCVFTHFASIWWKFSSIGIIWKLRWKGLIETTDEKKKVVTKGFFFLPH